MTSVTTCCGSQTKALKRSPRFGAPQATKAARVGVVPTHNKRMQRTRVMDKFVLRSGHRRVADARR